MGTLILPPLPRLPQSKAPSLPRSPVAKKSALVSPTSERVPLEEYRILRTIGTGSFARVKLAVHRMSQETVAIKIMNKQDIVRKRQVEHVRSEKNILSTIDHPFIARVLASFQDKANLYLVQEYVAGGELYRHLRVKGKFTASEARFYACEVVSALVYLHGRRIAYRDIKPENVLLTSRGHIKLIDFGFAKLIASGEKTFTLCGTPEYLAPEVIQQRGHDCASDWWGLGVLLYEMVTGHAPFMDPNPFKLYEKIVNSPIAFPSDVDSSIQSLITGLTEKLPVRRLHQRQVLSHEFFAGIDWQEVIDGELHPPLVPYVRSPDDAANFEVYEEESEQGEKVPVTFDMFPNF